MDDEILKENYKTHLASINDYLVSRYLKYDIIKDIFDDNESVVFEKMRIVKRISGFPPIMNHPIWNKSKMMLKNIEKSYIGNEQDSTLEEEKKCYSKREQSMFLIDKYEEASSDSGSWIDHSSLSQKMKIFNDWFTSISRAFLLLAEDTNEVTPDDLMQFTAFVFVLSEAKGIISSLEYVKAFTNIFHENEGMNEYVITTASSCIEYIKSKF